MCMTRDSLASPAVISLLELSSRNYNPTTKAIVRGQAMVLDAGRLQISATWPGGKGESSACTSNASPDLVLRTDEFRCCGRPNSLALPIVSICNVVEWNELTAHRSEARKGFTA